MLKRNIIPKLSPANLRQTPRRSQKAIEAAETNNSPGKVQRRSRNSYFKCALYCMKQLLKSSTQTPLAVKELIEEISEKEQTSKSGQPSKQRNEDKSKTRKSFCTIDSPTLDVVEETSDKEGNTGNSVSIPDSCNSAEVLNCTRSKTSSTSSTGSIVSVPASSILETPNSSRSRSSTTPSNQKAVQLEINVQKDRHEKIVLIDNIKDPKLFTDSQEILREIKKYSDIQIDYAYQLARGGVAIHVKSIEDRDLLFQKLTPESFGGGKKHFPLVEKPSFIFVKGVDTSYHHTELVNSLLTKGLHIYNLQEGC